jgi:hypothetical protein
MTNFVPDMLTFQEFALQEALPLATIQQAVLEFLRNRDDVAVFGAQAVNAYVAEPRMTQNIDLLSTRAALFAEELRQHLAQRFHVAIRTRQVAEGRGLRLFQVRKSGNRHLVDVRAIDRLPDTQRIAQVLVIAPADLIASKVIAFHQRRGKPKSGTDWRDLAMLLLTFPELKQEHGLVAERLQKAEATPEALAVWGNLVAQELRLEDEEDEF